MADQYSLQRILKSVAHSDKSSMSSMTHSKGAAWASLNSSLARRGQLHGYHVKQGELFSLEPWGVLFSQGVISECCGVLEMDI